MKKFCIDVDGCGPPLKAAPVACGQTHATGAFHDCGQIINPDGVRNQIEGGVIQMVSRTLIEELKFDRSRVTSLDWASYPILTFPDVPDVVIDLINRPTEVPWGAGEPACAVVPSAIYNAIFDATGAPIVASPAVFEALTCKHVPACPRPHADTWRARLGRP